MCVLCISISSALLLLVERRVSHPKECAVSLDSDSIKERHILGKTICTPNTRGVFF